MDGTEFANVGIVSEHMTCDGARFSLPHMGDDLYFQNKEYIYKLLADAGMSDEEVRNAVKTAVVKGGKSGGSGMIDTWWVNGKAAEVIGKASEQFARATSEIHLKCFWAEVRPGSHDAFIDALWSTKFQLTMAGFRGKPSSRSRRTSGHRGARIGNPTSDNHKVIYKGTNEKTGMEVHLKGRQLGRIKEATKERHKAERKRNPKVKFWEVLVSECSYYAAQTLLKSLRDAGINVTDYFKGVSSVSWEKPLHGDDTEALDSAQEAWYVSTATEKAQKRLPHF